ncbi:apolipoprotein L2-like [Hippopotamus amphibius kiboko]|uniref:apolipoprotein L2-like n=1 Tax=Hippopotamus amphibius kiboko TaxID=575201 RepID=UPI002592C74D|nr:apolipoprotein L2-like [Hippopotamus amphibius kiboko]
MIEPTVCFLFPKGEATPHSSLTQTGELKGRRRDPAAATMSSGNLGDRSDIEGLFEAVIDNLWDIMSREELLLLLTKVLNRIETEASLSREDIDALHVYLSELESDLAGEHQKDQLHRKRFLRRFPQVKRELEMLIEKLQALADNAEKVHRDCTISNVAAASAGAASGVLTILGLALAPVTAGVSLALSATGLGLGAAAAVTSVSTGIVEYVSRSSAETEASRLMSSGVNKWKMLLEVLKSNPQIVYTTKTFTEAVDCIEMIIQGQDSVSANPGLAPNVNVFAGTGRISVSGIQHVEGAIKGTALAMTKGARIIGAATAGVFLLVDVGFLVKESMHLHEGAKSESADRLRQQAWELERKLEELTRIYESLQ